MFDCAMKDLDCSGSVQEFMLKGEEDASAYLCEHHVNTFHGVASEGLKHFTRERYEFLKKQAQQVPGV